MANIPMGMARLLMLATIIPHYPFDSSWNANHGNATNYQAIKRLSMVCEWLSLSEVGFKAIITDGKTGHHVTFQIPYWEAISIHLQLLLRMVCLQMCITWVPILFGHTLGFCIDLAKFRPQPSPHGAFYPKLHPILAIEFYRFGFPYGFVWK